MKSKDRIGDRYSQPMKNIKVKNLKNTAKLVSNLEELKRILGQRSLLVSLLNGQSILYMPYYKLVDCTLNIQEIW